MRRSAPLLVVALDGAGDQLPRSAGNRIRRYRGGRRRPEDGARRGGRCAVHRGPGIGTARPHRRRGHGRARRSGGEWTPDTAAVDDRCRHCRGALRARSRCVERRPEQDAGRARGPDSRDLRRPTGHRMGCVTRAVLALAVTGDHLAVPAAPGAARVACLHPGDAHRPGDQRALHPGRAMRTSAR